MEIPNASNPIWLKVVSGEIKPNVQFLAIKILLNKLVTTYRYDSSYFTTQSSIEELRKLFADNIRIPKVQNDLTEIFGKEIKL
jgi:hypothetical protein